MVDLSHFLAQLIPHLEAHLAPTTVALYRSAFKELIEHAGNLPLDRYTPQVIEQFKLARAHEVSAVKVNIDLRTLRAAFAIAVIWDLLKVNSFRKCKLIRVPTKRPEYLTQEEFQRLLGTVDKEWFKELIQFAVSTMMRANEIVSLGWNSVDLFKRVIQVENTLEFRTKTHKPRSIPMNDWVYSFLRQKKRNGTRVFTFPDGKPIRMHYVSSKFKKYARRANLPEGIHFHSLRHTGATWLVQGDVPIYAIQQILGHSSVTITQIYAHLETSHLVKSIKQLDAFMEEGND